VSGIGNSVITVHFQGDYPLVLRGPLGKVHLKLSAFPCYWRQPPWHQLSQRCWCWLQRPSTIFH
jgi:hypothetical protein